MLPHVYVSRLYNKVSRILLSILADLYNSIVWIDSTHPLISKSSSPFNNLSVTLPRAPITIGIIVTFIFHSFVDSLARSRYLSFISHFFNFTMWSAGTAKLTTPQVIFFCFFVFCFSSFFFFFFDYYKVWSSGQE